MNEDQESEKAPVKPDRSIRGLIIVALVIFGGIWLFSAFRNSAQRQIDEVLNSSGCSLDTYRSQARPLMNELANIVESTDIRDATERSAAQDGVDDLLERIDAVSCKNEFPLKHETLEFAARHFGDALQAVDEGDLVEAGQALDRSLLNVEQFNDWSVDVGN